MKKEADKIILGSSILGRGNARKRLEVGERNVRRPELQKSWEEMG